MGRSIVRGREMAWRESKGVKYSLQMLGMIYGIFMSLAKSTIILVSGAW